LSAIGETLNAEAPALDALRRLSLRVQPQMRTALKLATFVFRGFSWSFFGVALTRGVESFVGPAFILSSRWLTRQVAYR